jgi:hypothetical protein
MGILGFIYESEIGLLNKLKATKEEVARYDQTTKC